MSYIQIFVQMNVHNSTRLKYNNINIVAFHYRQSKSITFLVMGIQLIQFVDYHVKTYKLIQVKYLVSFTVIRIV